MYVKQRIGGSTFIFDSFAMIEDTKTDELFRRILFQDDECAFRQIFYAFFAPLCVFAHRYIASMEDCEDMVQDVFYRIWKKRKELRVDSSARNFLMVCVRNACVDFLRKQEVEVHGIEYYRQRMSVEDELYTTSELEQLIEVALQKLPEHIASIFCMNRFLGKTYAEIAEEKQISIKTVEAYMSKALKLLRVELKDYLTLLVLGILVNL